MTTRVVLFVALIVASVFIAPYLYGAYDLITWMPQ